MTPREFMRQKAIKDQKRANKPYQKISNTFIENVINNNNASSIKTIYYLSTVLENMDLSSLKETELVNLTIDTKNMLSYTSLNIIDIRRNIKAMQQTSITFIDEKDNTIEGMSLLPRYRIVPGVNKIEIDLFARIARMIIDVKKNYTFIDTRTLMLLKSKHSLRLLPVLNKIASYSKNVAKRKVYTLDDLNDLFGTKYTRLKEIERKILDPVKNELDMSSKLSFVYEINFESVAVGRPKASKITIDVIDNSNSLFAL